MAAPLEIVDDAECDEDILTDPFIISDEYK